MTFTTYFAMLYKLPSNVIPVSICGKCPDWYNGLEYKKLAPKYEFFKIWKETKDNDYYIEHFNKEVLDKLTQIKVVTEIQMILPNDIKEKMQEPFYDSKEWHVALVCYEKPGDFCHRHLVADWLNKDNFRCKEFNFSKS